MTFVLAGTGPLVVMYLQSPRKKYIVQMVTIKEAIFEFHVEESVEGAHRGARQRRGDDSERDAVVRNPAEDDRSQAEDRALREI